MKQSIFTGGEEVWLSSMPINLAAICHSFLNDRLRQLKNERKFRFFKRRPIFSSPFCSQANNDSIYITMINQLAVKSVVPRHEEDTTTKLECNDKKVTLFQKMDYSS